MKTIDIIDPRWTMKENSLKKVLTFVNIIHMILLFHSVQADRFLSRMKYMLWKFETKGDVSHVKLRLDDRKE